MDDVATALDTPIEPLANAVVHSVLFEEGKMLDAFGELLTMLSGRTVIANFLPDHVNGAEVTMSADRTVRLMKFYRIVTDDYGYRLHVATVPA